MRRRASRGSRLRKSKLYFSYTPLGYEFYLHPHLWDRYPGGYYREDPVNHQILKMEDDPFPPGFGKPRARGLVDYGDLPPPFKSD